MSSVNCIASLVHKMRTSVFGILDCGDYRAEMYIREWSSEYEPKQITENGCLFGMIRKVQRKSMRHLIKIDIEWQIAYPSITPFAFARQP